MSPSPVDTVVLEVDPRVGFWLLDRIGELRAEGRRLRREWRRLKIELEALRMSNPTLFDQLAVVALAAMLEIVVSYAKRKEHRG